MGYVKRVWWCTAAAAWFHNGLAMPLISPFEKDFTPPSTDSGYGPVCVCVSVCVYML